MSTRPAFFSRGALASAGRPFRDLLAAVLKTRGTSRGRFLGIGPSRSDNSGARLHLPRTQRVHPCRHGNRRDRCRGSRGDLSDSLERPDSPASLLVESREQPDRVQQHRLGH